MARVPDSEQVTEMLVNCKTYAAVSRSSRGTVYTGGVTWGGEFGDRKVLAWSYYRGYLRFSRERGEESALREVAAKVKRNVFAADWAAFAIFGARSRNPNNWMISGLYRPPKAVAAQRGLP